MGAWTFVAPRLRLSTAAVQGDGAPVSYVGRPVAASPAAGAKKMHDRQQNALVTRAFQ
jgi:2-oxoglutarate dehydrogenase complex dehydrogenase (E1) component-like enzyme